MKSSEDVSRFLRWYHEDRDVQLPTVDRELPSWLGERTPSLIDEGTLVALGDYDLKSRLSDDPPEVDGEWISPAERLQELEWIWQERYEESPDMQDLVDKTEAKLRRNMNLPGFNWRGCPGGYEYGRMNDQYRMIVERDASNEMINLVNFGGHELPKKKI